MIINDIRERDIDLLLAEEFTLNPSIVELFLSETEYAKASIPGVDTVEISHVEANLGESDVTVILDDRTAILIEDKIDAIAMPDQCGRYFKRGQKGIKDGSYDRFFVFIVAPEEYIATNAEAKKYPYAVSYQKLIQLFEQENSAHGEMRVSQLKSALVSAHGGGNKVVDDKATQFWKEFVEFKNLYYTDLGLVSNIDEKSADGSWSTYSTFINYPSKVSIVHKHNKGFIDLTFTGLANHLPELEKLLEEMLGDYTKERLQLLAVGKSATLRLTASNIIDFQKSLQEQMGTIVEHLELLRKMSNIAKKIDRERIIAFYKTL